MTSANTGELDVNVKAFVNEFYKAPNNAICKRNCGRKVAPPLGTVTYDICCKDCENNFTKN